jgi:DNA repair exonuclease SbcCD ATPase subunit
VIEQFKEVIEKNLPAQVGETLRKRLERCDELEKEIEEISKNRDSFCEALQKNKDVLEEKLEFIRKQKAVIDDIVDREKTVSRKEIDLEIREKTLQQWFRLLRF